MSDRKDDELKNHSEKGKSSEVAFKEALKSSVPAVNAPEAVLASVKLRVDESADVEEADVEVLLAEVQGHLDAEKIDALIDACQRECLQVIVRPFGIGRVLFEDKEGGNVDTIHNARKSVYATDQEKEAYKNRGEYDDKSKPYSERAKNAVHLDERYTGENKRISERRNSVGVKDSYANEVRSSSDKVDQDHVVSAKQTHEDPGRVLAEISTVDAANMQENRVPTDRSINRSKNSKDPIKFAKWLEDTAPQRQTKIAELKSRAELSDKERKELNKLTKLEQADPDAIRKHGQVAHKAQDRKYNQTYYTSRKFAKSFATTSVKEGGKMALQQALGMLLEEFVRASFEEIRDVWKNGFKGSVDDAFLEVLKARLMRIAKRVQGKWKDAAYALRDGFISGFLSNLVTVLINTFATTLKRYVRMIREGFISLYRATKTIAFPDESVSTAEAADAALKILVVGLVTAGGVAMEAALEVHLQPLGPLKEAVLAASVGLVTGLATACTVYWLDKADLFGVQDKANKQKIIERLTGTIQISHERALEAAAIFDDPQLPHLP